MVRIWYADKAKTPENPVFSRLSGIVYFIPTRFCSNNLRAFEVSVLGICEQGQGIISDFYHVLCFLVSKSYHLSTVKLYQFVGSFSSGRIVIPHNHRQHQRKHYRNLITMNPSCTNSPQLYSSVYLIHEVS